MSRGPRPGEPPKAVFLDAGETLFRVTDPSAVYCRILSLFGYDISEEEMRGKVERAKARRRQEALPSRNEDLSVFADVAEARRRRLVEGILEASRVSQAHFRQCFQQIWSAFVGTEIFQLYPDVPEALDALRLRGYSLGVISNWEPRLPELCASHGIGHHFDFILASEAEGYVKPHPHMFRRALDLAGVSPSQALHVGDSVTDDVEGAQALGIEAILLARNGSAKPDGIPAIRSLAELPALLS